MREGLRYTSIWCCREANCKDAMETAERLFGIPLVVSPKDFASENLDELSGMTYLSYFMAENAPGYNATLNWVRRQIDPMSVDNFDVSSADAPSLSNQFAPTTLSVFANLQNNGIWH